MGLYAMSNYVPNVSNYVPNIGIASPQQAVKNLSKIAIPVITFVAASMINEAQAIPYAECIQNCNEHQDDNPLAILKICHILCFFFSDKK